MPEFAGGQSLYERTQGPNAVPVDQLVSRAEDAVVVVKRDYLAFLESQTSKVTALFDEAARNLGVADCWVRVRLMAQDFRSSSATAGYDQISAVAASLEWLLSDKPEKDPRILEVVRLHLSAIHQLVRDGAPHLGSPEVQDMLAQLGRASNILTRRRS